MSKYTAYTILILMALLAACGRAEPPDLVIPTVAATIDFGQSPTAVATTPSELSPTPTLPLPATQVLPSVTPLPTSTPLPTATAIAPTAVPPTLPPPTATALPPETTQSGYRVAFVAANDTLNIRRQPNPNAAVVGELPPNATGIEVIGEGQSVRGGGQWLPVDTPAGSGYVNSRFLTEDISREVFCADPDVTELLSRLRTAIAEEDEQLLSELVHPTRGLRLRVNWWNPEIIAREQEIAQLFRDRPRDAVDWGTEDGSGFLIRGTFSDVMLPRLERDLLGATEWACDQMLHGPTAGFVVLPEGYEAVHFYSAYRPAPAEQELDWGAWFIGIERWEGRYYVSYLVHYRWEI